MYGGFCESYSNESICWDCYIKNSFTNSFGFTFFKFEEKLFCCKPYDFAFRQVISDYEIEKTFDPEYYKFQKWISN